MTFHIDRNELMARIRSTDTGPELALRRACWALGLRYRLNVRVGRMRPDLVFVGPKLCVFVDGCFWHGCPEHYLPPRSNSPFWEQKLAGNVTRDFEQTRRLRAEGWRVLRLWEHAVVADPVAAAETVRDVLSGSAKTLDARRVLEYDRAAQSRTLVDLDSGDRSQEPWHPKT